MPAEPTQYERVNVIVPRTLKRELVKVAKESDSSLTRIMRVALKDYLVKFYGEKRCQKKTSH
jgi:hypothetical protein